MSKAENRFRQSDSSPVVIRMMMKPFGRYPLSLLNGALAYLWRATDCEGEILQGSDTKKH